MSCYWDYPLPRAQAGNPFERRRVDKSHGRFLIRRSETSPRTLAATSSKRFSRISWACAKVPLREQAPCDGGCSKRKVDFPLNLPESPVSLITRAKPFGLSSGLHTPPCTSRKSLRVGGTYRPHLYLSNR